MQRSTSIIVAALASLAVSGCASFPCSVGNADDRAAAARTPADQSHATATLPADSGKIDEKRLQDVMADLRMIGAIDPAAQDRLLEDLRRSDPAIWPLVVEQCRATLAYRRRAMENRGLLQADAGRLSGAEPPIATPATAEQTTPWWSVTPTPNAAGVQQPMTMPPSGVVQASYAAPATGDWPRWLNAAIAAMEADTPPNATTPAEVARQARLRMLYAAAGRRDEAARPIPGATPEVQQFVARELDGFDAWLDVERTPDAAQRAADAKSALVEALGKLAEAAPLVIRNPAFCTEVVSFGSVRRFEKNEFAANQEVVLYAEVENFASAPTPKGYHTSLRSTYEIVDSQGRCLAQSTIAPTEEYCQNLRRDFFMAYPLRVPKQLPPGRYTLRLKIEDVLCHKVGQTAIDFSMAKSEADR
ncbi:MAG: hypothetical protein ABFC96_06795 [Thermoguttaceae bacterium]